jgi:hypothetical protein
LQEAKDVKVVEAQIFPSYSGTGIAIMTTTRRIYIINSVDNPRIRRLTEIPGTVKSIELLGIMDCKILMYTFTG